MEKLIKNESCEILIIGAGITGLLTAYKLQSVGHDVMVIEKDQIGGNSTSKNTGLIQFSSDTMLHKLINNSSIDGVKFYKDCLDAVNEIEKIANNFTNKDCCRRCPSLYLASNEDDVITLKKEYETLTTHNFSVTQQTQEQIKQYGIAKSYGLLTAGDVSIYPYFYTQELASYFQKLGGRLYGGHFLNTKDKMAYLKEDVTIKYKYIIYAMGYDTARIQPIEGIVKDVTYAFLCNPDIKTKDIMVWETARPYLYQNTLTKDKIVVGGGDIPLQKSNPNIIYLNIEKIKQSYMKWYGLQELEIEESYCNEFFTFIDGIPKYRIEDKSIYMYPYGGNGVVYSLYLANQILQDVFKK